MTNGIITINLEETTLDDLIGEAETQLRNIHSEVNTLLKGLEDPEDRCRFVYSDALETEYVLPDHLDSEDLYELKTLLEEAIDKLQEALNIYNGV